MIAVSGTDGRVYRLFHKNPFMHCLHFVEGTSVGTQLTGTFVPPNGKAVDAVMMLNVFEALEAIVASNMKISLQKLT